MFSSLDGYTPPLNRRREMTKLLLEAIRALPKKWITDNTQVIEIWDGKCVAAHYNRAPIIYKDGKWKKIKYPPSLVEEIKCVK
jgi:hypothetical protein